jgi:hypothetical protein
MPRNSRSIQAQISRLKRKRTLSPLERERLIELQVKRDAKRRGIIQVPKLEMPLRIPPPALFAECRYPPQAGKIAFGDLTATDTLTAGLSDHAVI